MSKEFELNGCVEVPEAVTEDEFCDALFTFFESKGWHYGGGINEIRDGQYVMPDGSLGKSVLEEYLEDAESEKEQD